MLTTPALKELSCIEREPEIFVHFLTLFSTAGSLFFVGIGVAIIALQPGEG